jgi:hypothetical protein
MTTFAITLGTFGLGLCCLFAILFMLAIVQRVLPHDPPPLQDGESIASRLGKLHW